MYDTLHHHNIKTAPKHICNQRTTPKKNINNQQRGLVYFSMTVANMFCILHNITAGCKSSLFTVQTSESLKAFGIPKKK